MSSKYLGARFFKCDLQMQTPADAAHWSGEKFDMSEEPFAAAEEYIAGCYAAGLEAIAITDHNFVSKDFLPLLQNEAKKQAVTYELIIFPGFEICADVGKGLHVLAIFEPGAELETIDHILTQCGVPRPRQQNNGSHKPSNKHLRDILSTVQQGDCPGIVILPHSQSNNGIFDKSAFSEWLQQSEFTNPSLLALEVPKSPSKMGDGWQRLLGNGDDCEENWRRPRPIACIMSSDCKAISDTSKTSNVIGSRFSWIKMTSPSIESLRQAFLDHESRVRLSDEWPTSPQGSYKHPYIVSMSVDGAEFLADQEIHFSPNFNAFIGGRGTGKSTVVEYLRIGLDRVQEIPEELRADFENFRSTIASGGTIKVKYSKGPKFDDKVWTLASRSADAPEVADDDIGSTKDFLPVRIYSRGQIEAIANNPDKQRAILDDVVREQLDILEAEEKGIVSELKQLNSSLKEADGHSVLRNKLVSQIKQLDAQVEYFEARSQDLVTWKKWEQEREALDETEFIVNEEFASLQALAESLSTLPNEYDLDTPNKDFVSKQKAKMSAVAAKYSRELGALVDKGRAQFAEMVNAPDRASWESGYQEVETQYQTVLEQLIEQGLDPEEHPQNLERLKIAGNELRKVDQKLAEIKENRTRIDQEVQSRLLDVWRRQYELRESAAERLNQSVPLTTKGSPTVMTLVTQHGDREAFREMMSDVHRDRRRISDSDWAAILDKAHELAQERGILPLRIISQWIAEYSAKQNISDGPADVSASKFETIEEWLPEHLFNEKLFLRVPDSVRVTLHRREDGKAVGDLTSRNLSAGQKSTTVLSLILADGNTPIVVDQPEDDLDNEFVYRQLVPILRQRKEHRQIIVISHNANIPVNGDAELVVPLAVQESCGTQKTIEGQSCVGGLDAPLTRQAVELILEGSAEAFQKRKEKYGF